MRILPSLLAGKKLMGIAQILMASRAEPVTIPPNHTVTQPLARQCRQPGEASGRLFINRDSSAIVSRSTDHSSLESELIEAPQAALLSSSACPAGPGYR